MTTPDVREALRWYADEAAAIARNLADLQAIMASLAVLALDAGNHARAALAAADSVPEGWKLVPIEPTADMIQAMENRMYDDADYIDENSISYALWVEVYKNLLAACPLRGEAVTHLQDGLLG